VPPENFQVDWSPLISRVLMGRLLWSPIRGPIIVRLWLALHKRLFRFSWLRRGEPRLTADVTLKPEATRLREVESNGGSDVEGECVRGWAEKLFVAQVLSVQTLFAQTAANFSASGLSYGG
jgi:hypothetical protein